MRYKEERSLFIDRMIDDVHRMPIQNVIGQRINLKQNGRHYMGLCPFHRDTRLGSFIVTPDKGMWKCFTCGDGYGGEAIRFAALYDDVPWIEAAFRVALENGIITQAEHDKYNRGISKSESLRLEKKHEVREEQRPRQKKAPRDVVERTYLAMKELSPLKKEHREHLSQVRKLPEARINADYFTFPNYDKPGMAKKIMEKAGVSMDDLIHVPGFFFDKKKGAPTYMGSRGIGILIRDPASHVCAVQIRRDAVTEGQSRYHWFSSTFAANEPDKYEGGCGCGSAKDVLYPTGARQLPSLCITEGRFKSEVIARNGSTSISLQGVSSWKGIESEIRQVMERRPIKNILIMFDADMTTNKAVFDQTVGLSQMLQRAFPKAQTVYALWPKDSGKGIDDLVLAGRGSEMRIRAVGQVQGAYGRVYADLLGERGAKTIRDVKDVDEFRGALQRSLESALLGSHVHPVNMN